ncbi:MAG TPA: choice-of-anchor U domain-containing protein [Candidatus Saccharimonadales bacterium]|nr:choice-of-anchor U domain-containing protein [Candidatus Saccharimonadales bacterium]
MRRGIAKRFKIAVSALVLVISMMSGAWPQLVHATPPTSFTGPSSISGDIGNVTLADLQMTGDLTSSTTIQLRVSNGQLNLTDTTGVTVNGSNPSSSLSLTGTLANLNTALTHVAYTNNNVVGTDTVEATTIGATQVYFPDNGHVYQFVSVPGGITWNNAKTAADATTYQGLTGYLTTITSSGENDYVSARLEGAGWMGASDAASESVWKWVDGPESGTTFCNGNYTPETPEGCVPVASSYSDWNGDDGNGNPTEPNDSGGNEDCAQFLSGASGKWNDLPCSGANLTGYVVEFGAPGNLPTVASKDVSLTVTAPTDTVSSCAGLQALSDNDAQYDNINLTQDLTCTDTITSPLFSTDGYSGTFDGQGHTISGLQIDGPDGDAGLFADLTGATIKDLTIAGTVTSDSECVGGVAGYANNSSFENIHSSVTVTTSDWYAGGLIGCGYVGDGASHHISGSSATGAVSGAGEVGGLIGELGVWNHGQMTIEHTYATGNVSGTDDYVGGLLGYEYSESEDDATTATIQDVYAQGNVSSPDNSYVGGLIGYSYTGDDGPQASTVIQRAYASGDVTGSDSVGGLIGAVNGNNDEATLLTLHDTFAAGHVTADPDNDVAGLIGIYGDGNPAIDSSDNFFDQHRTGQTDCSAPDDIGACTAEDADGTHVGYFYAKTNAPMTNWDFNTIWVAHPEAYPTFSGTADDDTDGVTATVETAAPNGGDANGDGQADSDQGNVTSLVDPVSNKYAVLQSSGCDQNTNVSVAAESSNVSTDTNYSYPAGMMHFTLTCPTDGGTATITQYYYGNYPASKYVLRKYNSTTHTYQTVTGAALSNITIGGQPVLKVVYTVTDGGALDEDGTVNGQIVDPAGPALSGALTDTGTNVIMASSLGGLLLVSAVIVRRMRLPAAKVRHIPVRFE